MVDLQGGQLGFRNLIINGCCRVAQRGSVAAVGSAWTYGGCDRIPVSPSGFSSVSAGTIQQASAGTATASGYAQAVVGLTTTGSGSVVFGQKIESLNTKHLAGKTITISAKLYHDAGVTYGSSIELYKPSAADNFASISQVGSTVVTANIPSGAYTSVSASIPVGASDAANGLWVFVRFTGVGAVTTKNFAIGDFECVVGPQSPNFEMRPIGTELALCQRYYEQQNMVANAAGQSYQNGFYLVQKRVAPTIAVISGSVSPATLNSRGVNYFTIDGIVASNQAVSISASAEL